VELHEGGPLTDVRCKTGTPAVSGQRMKESGDYLIYGKRDYPVHRSHRPDSEARK
jgi:hypothetical protein